MVRDMRNPRLEPTHSISTRGEEVRVRERYEDEIEEILGQFERSSMENVHHGRLRKIVARLSEYGLLAYGVVNRKMGVFIFASTCLLLSAIIISAFVPGIFGPVLWLGVILMLILYLSIKSSFGRPLEKRWRGRYIEYDSSSQSGVWLRKLKDWFGLR